MLQSSIRLFTSRVIFSRHNSFKQIKKIYSIRNISIFENHLSRFNAVNYVNYNPILIKQLFSTSNSPLAKKNGTVSKSRKRILSTSSSDEDGSKSDDVVTKKSRSE